MPEYPGGCCYCWCSSSQNNVVKFYWNILPLSIDNLPTNQPTVKVREKEERVQTKNNSAHPVSTAHHLRSLSRWETIFAEHPRVNILYQGLFVFVFFFLLRFLWRGRRHPKLASCRLFLDSYEFIKAICIYIQCGWFLFLYFVFLWKSTKGTEWPSQQ